MSISPCYDDTDATARELAAHGSAAFPIACYHDDLHALPVAWHWHEEIEVLLVSEGVVHASAGAQKYTLNAGEGLFINAGVLHADDAAAPGPCRLHSAVFHPRLVGGGPDSVFWQGYLQPLLADPGRGCVFLSPTVAWQQQALAALETAWQAMAAEEPGYEFAVRAALSQIIFLVATQSAAARPQPRRALRNAQRMKTMLQFIHTHYTQPIGVEEIAASAAISPSECLRCFRDMVGEPPGRYLNRHRVQRGAELLYSTDAPVVELAARCGFADASYFARAFRRQYGCSPLAYRQQNTPAGRRG